MIGWYGDDNKMTATCWCQCLMRKRPHSLIRADSTLSSTIQSTEPSYQDDYDDFDDNDDNDDEDDE